MNIRSDYLNFLRDTLIGVVINSPFKEFDQKITEECRTFPFNETNLMLRKEGKNFPEYGFSMLNIDRMNNIRDLIEIIVKDNIEGDWIECGVWRGGASIFANAVFKTLNNSRKIYVADSFKGFQPRDIGWINHGFCVVDLNTVKENFKRCNLLDDNVIFIEGFFNESLPKYKDSIDKLSILRMDADTYNATTDILINLYEKVSINGFIIIDDFQIEECKQAVNDFRKIHNINDPIVLIDWVGAYWKKTC